MTTCYVTHTNTDDSEGLSVFETEEAAIDSLISSIDLDENTVIIVDRQGKRETKIIDMDTYNKHYKHLGRDYWTPQITDKRRHNIIELSSDVVRRFFVFFGKDMIEELRTSGYVDLPIEGTAHPVFNVEWLSVEECELEDLDLDENERQELGFGLEESENED